MSGDAPITERVVLRDGSAILVRPIDPGDKEVLSEGLRRMSPESRYRRFFTRTDDFNSGELRYLTEVDHHDHEALLAGDEKTGEGIGAARYVRSPTNPSRAEVAVSVVDDWHGRGVASELLRLLTVRARQEGITHFTATVLATNRPALDLLSGVGVVLDLSITTGTAEMLIELPETDDPAALGDQLRGSLRAVAAGRLEAEPWRMLKRQLTEHLDSVRRKIDPRSS
ncbi:MAG: GNAT family N-acetyltransferase [Solirubrobacterales bacterium]